MALSDRLINEVQFKCPGSTLNAIRMEVWNMIDDFCREGLAWRETIDVTLVAGNITYPITPAGTNIVHVYSVEHPTLDLTGLVYEFDVITLETAPTAAD